MQMDLFKPRFMCPKCQTLKEASKENFYEAEEPNYFNLHPYACRKCVDDAIKKQKEDKCKSLQNHKTYRKK